MNENPPSVGIEAKIFEAFKGYDVIPSDIFQKMVQEFGFRHVKKGTSHSKQSGAYLYQKAGAIYDDLEQARAFLAGAEELTRRGLLYPETKWGIYRRPNGHFHVFAVTRELAPIPLNSSDPSHLESWRNLRRPLYNVIFERAGIIRKGDDEKSDSENIKRALSDPNSLIHFLDSGEAGHTNNWGYSPKLGFYPVDVEVIMFRPGGKGSKMVDSNRRAVAEEREQRLSILTGLPV